MVKILHDLIYQTFRSSGGIVYIYIYMWLYGFMQDLYHRRYLMDSSVTVPLNALVSTVPRSGPLNPISDIGIGQVVYMATVSNRSPSQTRFPRPD